MTFAGWDVSISPHRPLHWYADATCYFITGATLHHAPHLRSDACKQRFIEEMLHAAEAWNVELVAWTVMEHHHHAILRLDQGRRLPRFIGRLHTRTAAFLNTEDNTPGRQIWRQYWDSFIRSEGDFWSRINYIWWNPVKHGFCARPQDWPWTNLRPMMTDLDEASLAAMQRFSAPRKLPGDEW